MQIEIVQQEIKLEVVEIPTAEPRPFCHRTVRGGGETGSPNRRERRGRPSQGCRGADSYR